MLAMHVSTEIAQLLYSEKHPQLFHLMQLQNLILREWRMIIIWSYDTIWQYDRYLLKISEFLQLWRVVPGWKCSARLGNQWTASKMLPPSLSAVEARSPCFRRFQPTRLKLSGHTRCFSLLMGSSRCRILIPFVLWSPATQTVSDCMRLLTCCWLHRNRSKAQSHEHPWTQWCNNA